MRDSRIARALRTLGSIVLLLVVFLTAGGLGYRAYLASPEVRSAQPLPTPRKPIAKRAIFFVIDAFTPGHAFDPAVMPTLAGLAAIGASGIAHTGPVTTTAPCVFSLTTGRPGSLVQAIFNFHAAETRVDSLLSLTAASGRRIALGGDPAWHRQFDWLVPEEDRYESPEPGITVDPQVVVEDGRTVDFLLGKMADPAYGLGVVHLGAADAAGHKVTPTGPEYLRVLTALDGLLARVVARVDFSDTLLLVTGDHGMAARGTHGGEEEARLTPYFLIGPGVKPGVKQDVLQTGLTSIVAALVGLPFLPVSESGPVRSVLAVSDEEAGALEAEYFAGKARAAGVVDPSVAPATRDNDRLNLVLFGSNDSRRGLRLLAAAVATLGVLGAALLAWSSIPGGEQRPPLVSHLGLAALVPAALALAAAVFLHYRALFAVESTQLALVIATGLIAGSLVVGLVAYRSQEVRRLAWSWRASVYFPIVVVASLPIVNSHWMRPDAYFGALLIGGSVALALLERQGRDVERWGLLSLPVVTGAFVEIPRLPVALGQAWWILPALSMVLVGVCVWRMQGAGSGYRWAGALLLCVATGTAWLWRQQGGAHLATVVFVLFGVGLMLATRMSGWAESAAALLVGISTAVFLVVAADVREALVFAAVALSAVLLSGVRIDLDRPGAIYAVAGVAILIRLCLFFGLGDQYNISSIRTAPGMVLADQGMPLVSVVGVLLLKYALPWVIVLAALLPSLAVAGGRAVTHLLDLLVLGYVARFALVAAIVDPCRILPNSMDGIVGMFCVSWAELLTFGVAALIVVLVVASEPGRPAPNPRAAA